MIFTVGQVDKNHNKQSQYITSIKQLKKNQILLMVFDSAPKKSPASLSWRQDK